jgi:hypothetical protein
MRESVTTFASLYRTRRARQMQNAPEGEELRLARGGGGDLLGREAGGQQRRAHGGRVGLAASVFAS